MILSRPPRLALEPFVELFWASDGAEAPRPGHARERMLPKGAVHIAIRLTDEPLRFHRGVDDVHGHGMRGAIVGGVRASPYIKSPAPSPSVGVQFRPGAGALFLGAPARLFAEMHCLLEDLWGSAAVELRTRLAETQGLVQRIDVLEAVLAARLPLLRRVHPAVAEALIALERTASVRSLAKRSGYSDRHFARLFNETVGLTPK